MEPEAVITGGKIPRVWMPWARPDDVPDETDLLAARELALRAGSFLTTEKDRPDVVLAMARPVEAFLFAGDAVTSRAELRARCKAAAQHLGNLEALGNPPAGGLEWFLAAVRQFHEFLTREQILVVFPAEDIGDSPEKA
jgi:hypothetical protein